MAEENGALSTDAGSSPVPAQQGELVSTVEFQSPKTAAADTDPEGAKKTEATADKQPTGKEAEGAKAAEDGKDKKPSGEDERFDKHPRFQELHKRVKESDAVIRELREQVRELSTKMDRPRSEGADNGQNLPFKDISKMKPEELLDWQSENPHDYYKNVLAQAKHEISAEFSQGFEQKQKEDAIVATYEGFAKQHPDFDEMWDAGDLQKFMQANPGHNAISAYWAMTAEAKVNEAAEKAAKEAESKFLKNQRAKKAADVLPQGPSAPGAIQGDEALKDTKKFGGSTAVLAQRLEQRRRSQAGV
jgi:hypothetical protein